MVARLFSPLAAVAPFERLGPLCPSCLLLGVLSCFTQGGFEMRRYPVAPSSVRRTKERMLSPHTNRLGVRSDGRRHCAVLPYIIYA